MKAEGRKTNGDWKTVTLGGVFDIARGGSPRPIDDFITDDPDGVNWIMISDATSKYITSTKKRIIKEGMKKSREVHPGDFLLTNSMSFGRPYIMKTSGCIHDGWLVLSPRGGVAYPDYFYHLLGSDVLYAEFERRAAGVTVKNLNIELVKGVEVLLPPLAEQRRIAEVLDRAEALRAKRRSALAQLDTLTQSIFLDLFGDPASNPKGWPCKPVGAMVSKISDGPFGSNLKSEHYIASGIRVIRLQNIGVGKFINENAAFISESHFTKLRKHECRPGDVIVGTLGDPNLRACIQPDWLTIALNKSDCVQLRPDVQIANATYICALLNQPATERMAQELMHGQTRVRICMGRLRGLVLPVPPIELQCEFARRVSAVEKLKAAQRASLAELEALFATLQHRAFRGEL